jgi:hypothetical protein
VVFFQNSTGRPSVASPNHWVRLIAPMEFDGTRVAKATVFSWGTEYEITFPDKPGCRYEETTFDYVVGSRDPGVVAGLPGITLPDLGSANL